MTRKLLILGDSISLGVAEIRGNDVVDRVETSYVDHLAKALPGIEIIVDADTHRSTTAACKTIDTLLATHRPDAVLIMLGGNDGDIDWRRFVLSNGTIIRSRNSVEAYDKNLRQLATKILAAGAVPILTDMPNHHFELRGPYISRIAERDVTTMLERGGGQAASDSERAKYRQTVEQIATDLSVSISYYGEAMEQHPPREMVGIDGAHPSNAGHAVIAQALIPDLLRACRPRLQPAGLSA
jgi:lysophospholipase L1-like esterase